MPGGRGGDDVLAEVERRGWLTGPRPMLAQRTVEASPVRCAHAENQTARPLGK